MKILRTFFACLAMLLAVLAAPLPASAATYYVRKTGNDSTGDGSNANPWATYVKAKNTISIAGGHTVKMGTGGYDETDGAGYPVMNRSFVNPVVFESESGNPADVTLSSVSGTYNIYQNGAFANFTFRNITIKARTGTDCFTYNESAAFSGLRFENVIFDADGSNSTRAAFRSASATPGAAITQSVVFDRCTLKASGGVAGWGIRGSVNASAPTGTRLNIYAYNCRADDGSLNAPFEAGIGCGGYVYAGRWFGAAGKGVQLAIDGPVNARTTAGGVYGAHIKSVSSHAFLVGGGAQSVPVWGNLVEDGDHAAVFKACDGTLAQHNVFKAGSINAILLKGAKNGIYRYNQLRSNLTLNNPTLANYDGDPTYVNTGNQVLSNLVVMVGTNSKAIRWDSPGDGGGNIIDYTGYRDRRLSTNRSLTWGQVLATADVGSSIAGIKAAFVAGNMPKNEKNAAASIPLITHQHSASGAYLYALIFNSKGEILTSDGFVVDRRDELGFLPQCTIPMYEEIASSKTYQFIWPRHLAAGTYKVRIFSVAEWGFASLSDTYLGEQTVAWPDVASKVDTLRNTPIPPR